MAIKKENLNVQDIGLFNLFNRAALGSSLQKVINLDGHAEKEEETINTNLNYSHGKEIDEGHYSKKDAFTLSRGYRGDEGPYPGSAILTRKAAFEAFVIVGTIAMVHPSSAVFLHFSLTVMEDPTQGGTAMRRLMGKQKIKELDVKSIKLEGAKA
ncbi:hypothetical protein H0E87_018736 [Populus deltoides]|uniref:PGG domain-containing protein n=1 Tax=Populus deltoides TaxID=3696 RepID=A0A8T2XRN9_POPDE|nr:hypothetical protein H0E87_018736 [Populus deltoides]